jgi:hypothetical protein
MSQAVKYIGYVELEMADTGLNRFAIRIRPKLQFVNLKIYLSLTPCLFPG